MVAGNQPVLVHNCSTIDPFEVGFSQDSISNNYSDRPTTVLDTAEGLRNGSIDAAAFPAIRVVQHNDNLYTLDNRRLAAFQMADKRIPYKMVSMDDPGIAETWRKHYTTKTGGVGILIKKVPGVGRMWWHGTR